MIILLNDDKSLLITKRTPVYKFETGSDTLKYIIPNTINNQNMNELNCIVLVKIPQDDGNTKGLYKYVEYDADGYKGRLSITIPITTTLTKTAGEITTWLLFIKSNPDNPKLASNVISTSGTKFTIEDNGADYMSSESAFDEIWDHSTMDELQSSVNDLSKEVAKKADNISIDEDNNLILKNGDIILGTVKLADDVKWEEWV